MINLFDIPRLPVDEELITILAEHETVRIERIVSTGQVSGWYDQAETEYVVLLEGSAEIEYYGGASVPMKKGDALLIRPHERHRVSYTSQNPPCVWLCIFF